MVLTNLYNQQLMGLKKSQKMPVMKERAFLILFACDYVNSRYRVKGREAVGARGRCREGPSANEGSQLSPPVEGMYFLQIG